MRCAINLFESLKSSIIKTPSLIAPDWMKAFRGHLDGSEIAVRGSLIQFDADGRYRVIMFFSKSLCLVKQNYTANDRELLDLSVLLAKIQVLFRRKKLRNIY